MVAAAAGPAKLTPGTRIKDLTDVQIRGMTAKNCSLTAPCLFHPDLKHHLCQCATFLSRYLMIDITQRNVPFDKLIVASKDKQIQYFTEFKTKDGALRYPDLVAKLNAM